MSQLTFHANPVSVSGVFPLVGTKAPDFTLCAVDLADIALSELTTKKIVLNIFPSVDTPVCAQSVRRFNEAASKLDNTLVVCISADLPFAMSRFCGAEGIENVKTLSFFRSPNFTQDYGVNLDEGALKGFAARAVIVIDTNGIVTHSELVSEITDEPNYEAALKALEK